MTTRRLTTAQAIVEFLHNQYVEFDGKRTRFVRGFFVLFGHGNVLGLGQALEENPGEFLVIPGRNEQGMAHAAIGFAKQKLRKQIFACTSSIGPGAANMVTAAATATVNRIPILLFPGDAFAVRQPDPVLQQIEQTYDHAVTTNDAFKPVSRYWDRVSRPEQAMTAMINAMRILTSPSETGAVTICLPQDVQGEVYDFPDYFFAERVHRIERPSATGEMIQQAVDLIKAKRKPLLICGGGVRYSEAGKAFAAFAERFNIPFGETQAGKSAVSADHPLNLGGIGTTGNLAANLIAKETDVVVGVGTRFSDFTTASKSLFQNPDVDFVSINVASLDACKLDAVPVLADAERALEQLSVGLEKVEYRSSYQDEISQAKQKWEAEWTRLHSLEYTGEGFVPEVPGHLDEALPEYSRELQTRLTQTRVLAELNLLLDYDAIVVGSSGSLPGCMQRMWNARETETYNMEYGFSCMGYEICGALGAKLAEPEREVYACVGDGSYMMLHSELITSIQEGQKINILLFDNNGFGCINNLEMGMGMGSFGSEFRYRQAATGRTDGDLYLIDFAKSASAYGARTYTVRTIEELREALRDAKKQSVSTLLDIKVLPKTMTGGYESWWRCGVAQTSRSERVRNASEQMLVDIEHVRKY
ncbi:MAG TPA: 3D-(3,5/4)-trihydroxycyclohexane-1,2-dione acylhydrolase (decyclizing) [Acidobacteriota bacterium]|nr:3D-(3,5/4)-trihydroxycyclohexane-1,2-dione acylhydrolase (decyclizing) [Acidobacteriota bacterium]